MRTPTASSARIASDRLRSAARTSDEQSGRPGSPPETTPSGFLGGMCLGAACGRWDAGWPETIDPRDVWFLGVRDLDPGEKVEVEAAGVRSGVPSDGPVYVHLDLDALDPSVLPTQFPVPGGMQADEVRSVLAGLVDDGRLVGLEVTAFEQPRDFGEHFKARYGPTIVTRGNAAKNGVVAEFDAALDQFCDGQNLSSNGTARFELEYLLAVGTRA